MMLPLTVYQLPTMCARLLNNQYSPSLPPSSMHLLPKSLSLSTRSALQSLSLWPAASVLHHQVLKQANALPFGAFTRKQGRAGSHRLSAHAASALDNLNVQRLPVPNSQHEEGDSEGQAAWRAPPLHEWGADCWLLTG